MPLPEQFSGGERMPIYEYYCEHCDGIFEALRPMREASDPVPCPLCSRDGQRVMPTSFSAFTYRDGYPRAIPDRNTYYHLGTEVKRPISGPVRPNEHPDLKYEDDEPAKTKGDLQNIEDWKRQRLEDLERKREEGIAAAFSPEDQKHGIPEAYQAREAARQAREE